MMNLSPREIDKLTIVSLGQLAQSRLARGIRLNAAEAIALISFVLHELARDGKHTGAELASVGRTVLGRRLVVPAVFCGPGAVAMIQIEPTLPTGSALVTVHHPIGSDWGDLPLALYGSAWRPPVLPQLEALFPAHNPVLLRPHNAPGAIRFEPGSLEFNGEMDIYSRDGRAVTGRRHRHRIFVTVTNTGDRPVQIGSHLPFVEANPKMRFDRLRALGFRLDILAGTSCRFEAGVTKRVRLVEIGGFRTIKGGNGFASFIVTGTTLAGDGETPPLCHFSNDSQADSGMLDPVADMQDPERVATYRRNISRAVEVGYFTHQDEPIEAGKEDSFYQLNLAPSSKPRAEYAALFGPTTGDRIRLGPTSLWIRIENDLTVRGEECTFGAGKTVRDGMGQATGRRDDEVADCVITNVIILDWSGIIKADIAIKDGRISGIGKAGNPDMMDGVGQNLVIGCGTDVIAGEGRIVTAGAIDTHIHWICPQQAEHALMSGVTTMIGGGTGPSSGSNATTCTPGATGVARVIQALDSLPVNYGVTGKGNDSGIVSMRNQIRAGVVGLKLHEDYGCTPTAIDACLRMCDEADIQCLIHTDTINECGFVEQTLAAIGDRTIHTYHSEGAGGGHAPDILKVVGQPHIIPSSTNPTRPLTINTVEEHVDMVMVCHHLNRNIPEDVAFADSRIRENTIAAEDVLHDLGAISIMSSDSQAMGRCAEVILRTWHTGHKNKVFLGHLGPDGRSYVATPSPDDDVDDGRDDNLRALRYVSKYTINPALAHGISDHVGSIEVGKLADLVIYRPAVFPARPDMIIKGGVIAAAAMGDPNASLPTVQPVIMRPMFGTLGGTSSPSKDVLANLAHSSFAFVSHEGIQSGTVESYGLKHKPVAVSACRSVGKKDMKWNDYAPQSIEVDPETYVVKADGLECVTGRATELPMAQDYFVF